MAIFRTFLVLIILVVGLYTVPVLMDFGILSLLPSFFGEMSFMSWQGQFNLDFLMFLLMSGFWIAWRNQFSPTGLALGVGGVFLGAPYLAAYLLYLSFRFGGDAKQILMGEREQ